MNHLTTPEALRAWSAGCMAAQDTIVLVPTMGYLHAGHAALVHCARERGRRVLVSIFVNPTQFGPREDLSRYPRDLPRDMQLLEGLGVDAVFTPQPEAMYPPGFDTYIEPQALAKTLCGHSRPQHFRGVCTVVAMLFRMSRCHGAVFGEKDYQQLQIIRRMVRDLWLDVEIIAYPIVREPDGLALSSRNAYLDPTERRDALCLSQALNEVENAWRGGERRIEALTQKAQRIVESAASARIDYISIVDAETLQPLQPNMDVNVPLQCALAVWIGKTRLIDNQRLSP